MPPKGSRVAGMSRSPGSPAPAEPAMTTNIRAKSSTERPLRGGAELTLSRPGQIVGKACLLVLTGEAEGAVFLIDRRAVLIGRSAEAHVRINEQGISTEHALLEIDGDTSTLLDLGSTNGTFVNGQRIESKVVLASGDSLQMGSTVFLFAASDAALPQGTIQLVRPEMPELVGPTIPPTARRPSRILVPASESQSGSISLTQAVTLFRRYWTYTRRYGWIVALGLCAGAGGGSVHARLIPPPGSAWFEMDLASADRDAEHANVGSLSGAESTFRSLPLIKRTLLALNAPAATDTIASLTQLRLTFKRVTYDSSVFRGEYEDTTADRAAAFLDRHVRTYVDAELDKTLKVLRQDAQFDRDQEQKAAQRVAEARSLVVGFSNLHPNAVPRDALLPEPPPANTGGGTDTTNQLAAAERALNAAQRAIQSRKAASYLEAAAAAETKIADARARGLKDQHPELRSLLTLQQGLREKANALLATEPSASEKAADPEVVRLQEELTQLRARASRSPTPGRVAPARPAPAPLGAQNSLPELRIQYRELAGEYERAKVEHDALLKKSETTERQLERERTSAEARYQIITPPTPAKTAMTKVMAQRIGLGAALGLVLALAVAAALELRRLLISRGHI
jgi:pSer/pThr/pTyr-binding forkhead associated (FHA) protein